MVGWLLGSRDNQVEACVGTGTNGQRRGYWDLFDYAVNTVLRGCGRAEQASGYTARMHGGWMGSIFRRVS